MRPQTLLRTRKTQEPGDSRTEEGFVLRGIDRDQVPCTDVDAAHRRSPNRYALLGLVAETALGLPLPLASAGKRVEILTGMVSPGGEILYEASEPAVFRCYKRGDEVVLEWEDVTFSVSRDRVVIDARRQDDAIQLLVPAVWSVVLAAHERESLHGSAVSLHGSGIAILGQSGSGKSTAAWNMVQRGWQLVSDDLLTFDSEQRVYPGPPWMRFLSGDNDEREGPLDAAGKVRVSSPTSSLPVGLSGIVVMQPGCEQFVRLTGTSAASALLQHIYNPLLTNEGQARRRFDLVHSLAESVPVFATPPRTLSADQLEDIALGGTK